MAIQHFSCTRPTVPHLPIMLKIMFMKIVLIQVIFIKSIHGQELPEPTLRFSRASFVNDSIEIRDIVDSTEEIQVCSNIIFLF